MYQDMMDTIGFVGKYDPEVSAAKRTGKTEKKSRTDCQ